MKKFLFVSISIILALLLQVKTGNTALTDWNTLVLDTVHIGDQIWMKHNLSVPMPNGYWYERDSVANKKYGQLYFSSNAFAACPKGWHLPSDEEWQKMINFLGGDSLALVQLLPGGKTGMNLTMAGYRSANSPNDLFGKKEEIGFYWTSTIKEEQTAYARTIKKDNFLLEGIAYRRANGFSVRYIKN